MTWSDFDKFNDLIEKYLPAEDEGNTLATQTVTAVTKLVYKWFNDGDVFDNTHGLEGWANDLSSYANWLYHRSKKDVKDILKEIKYIYREEDYEKLLYKLSEALIDEDYLSTINNYRTSGSVYDCDRGPFKFMYEDEDDEEEEECYGDLW